MLAADNPAIATPAPIAAAARPASTAAHTSLFGRLGALLTQAAHAGAAEDASDGSVWTSIARGF